MVNSKEKNSNNELKKNPNPEIHFPSLLLFIQFQNPVAAWTWKSRPYMAEKAVIEILTVTKQFLVSWKAHIVYCSESVIHWRRYLHVKKQWNWIALQTHLTRANTRDLIVCFFFLRSWTFTVSSPAIYVFLSWFWADMVGGKTVLGQLKCSSQPGIKYFILVWLVLFYTFS